jgi:hypothetical protein
MQRQIPESDWKALRRMHPLALERYCERVLGEIDRARQDSARSFHRRYLDIFEIVERRDREIAGIFNDLKRSNAFSMLARMHGNKLLSDEELSSLSEDTRAAIDMLLGR